MNPKKIPPLSPSGGLAEKSGPKQRRGLAERTPKDLAVFVGKRFGSLVVTGEAPRRAGCPHKIVATKCDCGNIREFPFYTLKCERATHCGCLTFKHKSDSKTVHGHYANGGVSKFAYRLNGMIQRCYNSDNAAYHYYGAKGIKVCDRWRFGENGKSGVECLMEDVGEPPSKGHSIDRFPDKNGNYEPGNVRWATSEEQMNNRRDNFLVKFRGKSQALRKWSRELGISYHVIFSRICRMNWTIERALTTKARTYSKP